MDSLDRLAGVFERFASVECERSPLYRRLAAGVAADPELLSLADSAASLPKPNLLFAAVHYLLLKGAEHPLRRFYPSLLPGEPGQGDPYPTFREFCFEHRTEIEELLKTRRVQTNEVARSAFLLPAFHALSRRTGRALALVEVGCSAGLLLLWDRYRIDYGVGGEGGDPRSPVRIGCAVRGGRPLPLQGPPPAVAFRAGVDLHPVDLREPDQALWLRALVWGDQPERAERLEQAIRLAVADPPPLVAGDALGILPGVLAQVPADGVTQVVFHAHTLNQFPAEAQARFAELLCAASREWDLYQLSLEARRGAEFPEMRLALFRRGVRADQWLLARYQAHGEWLEWLG